MEIVVAVDIFDRWASAFDTAVGPVGCIYMTTGEVVSSTVVT